MATPAIAALAVIAPPADAATRFWDLNGATAGAGGASVSGTWDEVSFNWNAAAAGTGAATFITTADTGLFSAGGDATGASTITLDDSLGDNAITSVGLTVEEGAITFAGTSSLQLTGAALSVGTGASLVIPNAIDGTLGLTKSGGGSATLNGTNVFAGAPSVSGGTLTLVGNTTFVGTTTISGGGILNLDNSVNNTSKIDSTAVLTMGSGEFNLIGVNGAASTSQAVASVSLTSSTGSSISVTKGDTQNADLNVGAITRGALAVTNFSTLGAGPGVASITTSSTNTGSMLGPWATYNKTDYASVSGGTIGAVTTYVNNDFTSSSNDVDVTSSQSPAADFNVNTIRMNAGGTTLTLAGSNNQTNAILIGAGVGAAGATLAGGGLTSAGELIVHQHNTAADFVVTGGFTGSAAVTKGGNGVMRLDGVNTNASFAVVGGQLKIGANERIANASNVSVSTGAVVNLDGKTETLNQLTGFGNLTPAGGTLGIAATGNTTFAGTVSLGSTAGTTFNQPNAGTNFTISGVISGSAKWAKTGPGTMILGNTANTYTGGFRIAEGTLVYSTFEGAADNGVARASGFAPSSPVADFVVLDGGTMKYNNAGLGSTFLSSNKGVTLTANGGGMSVDATPGSLTTTGISSYFGKVSAPAGGTLYKRGTGEIRATHNTDVNLAQPWEQTQLVVEGGLFRIGNLGKETGFGIVPASYDADAILLAGTAHDRASGGVGIATTAIITTPPTRGITMNAFGGTLATSVGAGNAWTIQSIITGGSAASALNINGNGFPITGAGAFETQSSLLVLSGANTYLGATKINVATLVAQGGAAIPDTSSVILDPAATQTANFRVDASETIGSLAGGNTATTFGGVILNSADLTTGADNTSTTYDGVISGTGNLTKTGTGTQTLTRANTYVGNTSANAGTLRFTQPLTNSPTVSVSGTGKIEMAANGTNNNVLKATTVTASGSGRIDLKDNKLVTSGPLGTWVGSAYTDLSGLVDSGRGNASNAQWDGSGIVTSDTRAVNNNDLVSIGTAKVGTIKGIADGATTTFGGQTVLGSDNVAMVTWGGDANLDGKINIDDYGQIDFNVGSSGSVFGWYNGDFNYDGKINIDDYGIIDFNVTAQNLVFPTAGGSGGLDGVAAVPEPASLSLIGLGVAGLMRRRRRD